MIIDLSDEILGYRQEVLEQGKLFKFLQKSYHVIGIVTTEGKLLYINPAIKRVLGFSPEEVLGKNVFDFIHPADLPRLKRKIDEVLENKAEYVVDEFWIKHKNGSWRYFESVGKNLMDGPEQNVIYISSRDITRRREAEQAKERLISIFESTSDFVGTATVDGKVLTINSSARKIKDLYDGEDITKMRIADFHPAWAYKIIAQEGIPTAIREGIWSGETAILTREGEEIPMSQIILSHKGADGEVEYLSTIMRDISERKKIEKDFLLAVQQYKHLIDYAADAMIIFNKNGHIRMVNTKATELFGYKENEMLHLNLNELFVPEERQYFHKRLKSLQSNKAVISEYRMQRMDGTVVYIEMNSKLLPDGRFHSIIRDITKRRRRDDEIRKLMKSGIYEKLFIKLRIFQHGESMIMNINRIGLFAENATTLLQEKKTGAGNDNPILERFQIAVREYKKITYHELKSIGMILQLIGCDEEQNTDTLNGQHSGELIVALSDRLFQLIEAFEECIDAASDIKAANKKRKEIGDTIDELKAAVCKTIRSIETHVVSDVWDIAKTTAEKYQSLAPDVTISLNNLSPDVKAIINGLELGQILSVILDNAIDALSSVSAEGNGAKKISITLKSDNNKIKIEIEDNGRGVPKEYKEFIFNRGFSTKGVGRGFGLSYARECIEKYRGEICLDAEVDSGSRFVIELLKV